jgi:hypothetical protein
MVVVKACWQAQASIQFFCSAAYSSDKEISPLSSGIPIHRLGARSVHVSRSEASQYWGESSTIIMDSEGCTKILERDFW